METNRQNLCHRNPDDAILELQRQAGIARRRALEQAQPQPMFVPSGNRNQLKPNKVSQEPDIQEECKRISQIIQEQCPKAKVVTLYNTICITF